MNTAKLAAAGQQRAYRPALIDRYFRRIERFIHYDQQRGEYLVQMGTRINVDKGIKQRLSARLARLGGKDIARRVNAFLAKAILNNSVTDHGAIAGMRTGKIIDSDEGCWLVTSQADLIEPQKGNWDTLGRLIETLLGDTQTLVFHEWVRTQLRAVRTGAHVQAPILSLVGDAADGKSLLTQLIVEALGGRRADPLKAWSGNGPSWTDHLLKAECLVIDDANHRDDQRGRNTLASEFKRCIYSGPVQVDKRFTTSFTVRPVWNVMMVCNVDSDSIRVLPDPDKEDFADKIILLRTAKAYILYRDQDDAMIMQRWDAYVCEIPAYLHYLLNDFAHPDELPPGVSTVRGGLVYHNPEALDQWRAASPEGDLAAQIEDYVEGFPEGCIPGSDITTQRVREILQRDSYNPSLPKNAVLGRQLSRLAKQPDSYVCRSLKKARNGACLWTLCRPEERPDTSEGCVRANTDSAPDGEPAGD